MKRIQKLKIRKYIAVILLVVLVMILVNVWFYKIFKSQIVEINSYVKEQTIEKISDFYAQVDSFAVGTITEDEFNILQSLSGKREVYRSSTAIDIARKMGTVARSASMIKRAYVYLERTDLILCSSGILESETFYEIEEKKHFESYDDWKTALLDESRGRDFIIKGDVISFALAANDNFGKREGSRVILGGFTDRNVIFPKTPYVPWVSKCNIYVYSHNGKPGLYNENIKLDGMAEQPSYSELYSLTDKYDVSSYDVTVNGMPYNITVVFEKDLDMDMVKSTQLVLNTMMLLMFLIVAYLLYSLYTTRLKPIKVISELLQINIDKIDYRILEKPIKSIVDKNNILSNMLEDKDTELRTIVFNGLLNGDINRDILETELYGIQFKFDSFVVILINIYRDNELTEEEGSMLVKTFEDAIAEMVNDDGGTPYFVSKKQYLVCIYNTDSSVDLKKLGLRFAYLTKILEIDFEFVASIAISDVHEGYWQIPMAYSEALEVINKVDLFDKSKVALYRDLVYKNNRFRFNLNDEMKLAKAIRSGNKDDAAEVIMGAISRIDAENTFTYTNVSVGLISSLMRIADSVFGESYDTNDISVLLKSTNNIQRLQDTLIAFAGKMCDDITVIGEKEDFAKVIKEYIHANYDNPQLSTKSISDSFNYSVVHLNNTFRKKYNNTVIAYLNQYRIEQAKKLIIEGKKISDVSEQVGIVSVRTFNRLFQSITGMTPTEYREYVQKHEGEE